MIGSRSLFAILIGPQVSQPAEIRLWSLAIDWSGICIGTYIYCAIKYIAAANCISFRTQFRLYLVILLLKYSKEYIIDRRELMYMYTKPDKGYFQCKYLLLHLI